MPKYKVEVDTLRSILVIAPIAEFLSSSKNNSEEYLIAALISLLSEVTAENVRFLYMDEDEFREKWETLARLCDIFSRQINEKLSEVE